MPDRNPTKSLADLATLRAEKVVGAKDASRPYIGLEHIVSGGPFLLGTAPADSSISTNSVFYRGDVLFGKLRPNLRKSLPAPFDGYCSTDILVLEPNTGFDAGFVSRVFQRDEVFDEAVRTAEGTKMPRTSWTRLRDYSVFAADNDSERATIARVLDAADEAILKTEALIAKLKAIKQGLLHDLLTRGLDDNGELRDPEKQPEQFKKTPAGLVPITWDVIPLFLAATLQRGFDLPLQQRHPGNIPIYGSNGVDGWHKKKRVEGPGVITGRSGSIGFVYYCESDFWPLNTTLYVKDFHGNEPYFIRLLLQSLRLERFSASTGVPSLNRNFVHPTLVTVPLRNEQKLIADREQVVSARIESETIYLSKLKHIKKGLMQDLLTGRVRVNAEAWIKER